ncbi:hypothetical protein ACTXT7_005278 [Hymenolepis weldensis]
MSVKCKHRFMDNAVCYINKIVLLNNDPNYSRGNASLIYTSICTYLKLGPISGHPNERLLLIANSVFMEWTIFELGRLILFLRSGLQMNVKGVYLCDNSTKSVPCVIFEKLIGLTFRLITIDCISNRPYCNNTLYKIPKNSIQTIIVPTNSSDNYRHRELRMISFNNFKKDDRHLSSLGGYFVVVHITYRMELECSLKVNRLVNHSACLQFLYLLEQPIVAILKALWTYITPYPPPSLPS